MSEIEDVTEWLFGLTRFGVKNGTDNIRALLRRLGYPQLSFRAIHVAGSDGKDSACAMIDSVLRESGVCTGLFTSPHILRPNERIRVDGECISDDDFVRLAHLVRKEMDSGTTGEMIAKALSISRSTLYRRLKESGTVHMDRFTCR